MLVHNHILQHLHNFTLLHMHLIKHYSHGATFFWMFNSYFSTSTFTVWFHFLNNYIFFIIFFIGTCFYDIGSIFCVFNTQKSAKFFPLIYQILRDGRTGIVNYRVASLQKLYALLIAVESFPAHRKINIAKWFISIILT